jgi:hypothetical protein
MFGRFQLNFHAEPYQIDYQKLTRIIRQNLAPRPVIFQLDGTCDSISRFLSMRMRTESVYPLFDASSGAGVLPEKWPRQLDVYCGYAGGLSLDNLKEEMGRIVWSASGRIWIDAETHLRSDNDRLFDLKKVRRFLAAAKPWVIGA